MFLAPITLPRDVEVASVPSKPARLRAKPARVVRAPRSANAMNPERAMERAAVKRVLLAWLAIGCVVALLFPHWLFSRSAGASVAFWLIGAPLIDIAWLSRVRIVAACRRALSARRPRSQARRWTTRTAVR